MLINSAVDNLQKAPVFFSHREECQQRQQGASATVCCKTDFGWTVQAGIAAHLR